MEETKPRPGGPGDRAQVAAEKLRALRERANQALDEHRSRLAQIESELGLRVRQLADEFESAAVTLERHASDGRDGEVAALREQLEAGRAKHDKFVEQLALARRQLDAIQAQPCTACQEAAHQLADAQSEIGRLRDQLQAAERQQQEDRSRHDKFAEQIATARQAISDLQSKSHDQSAHLQLELEAAQAARAAAEQHAAGLARDLEVLSSECEALQTRIEQLEASQDSVKTGAAVELAAQERRTTEVQVELEAAREQLSLQVSETKAVQGQLADTNKQCEELRRERETWQQEKQSLEASLAAAKATADSQHETLATQLAAAEAERKQLQAELTSSAADKESAAKQLSDATAKCRELEEAVSSAQKRIESLTETGSAVPALQNELQQVRNEAKDACADRDKLRDELAAVQADLAKQRESTRPCSEFDDLQHKFDLALADVQKLKRENGELREELATRPEASDQESPELVAIRTERDSLAARVKELEKAANAAADEAASREDVDDLQRRFQMAVDDVRQLKQENSQLRDRLARSNASAPIPAATGGSNDWAAQKARLLAMLEQEEDGPIDAPREKERVRIQETIEKTDRLLAEKEREISELRAAHETETNRGEAAFDARRLEEVLDSDELIAAERQRLAELQNQWEEKLRAAELEFSVERAKLAREQAALKERLFDLQKLEQQAPGPEAGDAKPRRGWRAALGLGEEGDESPPGKG